MLLNSLTLTNVRAFNHAEFIFQPGMNLIVGINGVGKSTVLDAVRFLLSQALPKVSRMRGKILYFAIGDITVGEPDLNATLNFEIATTEFQYLVHQFRERYIPNPEATGEVREQAYEAIDQYILRPHEKTILKSVKEAFPHPLAIYFSPRRALASTAQSTSKTGLAAAFADALDHRELRLTEFADWFLAQKYLAEENAPNAENHLNALDVAVKRFIDNCSNLGVERTTHSYRRVDGKVINKTQATFLIDKSGVKLDIRQLSDGERGILALVLDLARRLSISNPDIEDPLQAQAVVLIDELDLHLHPKWQRTIVQKLTTTFPNCQFIATTHSPQIIGEVPPESIILLEQGQPPMRPDQSIGMDTDWILKYLMDAPTRNHETEQKLKRIAELIETEDYDEATDAIDHLRETIGEFPELVRLQTRIDRLQLSGE
jgi:predicted ATP-binding protein involved in virulence